MINVQSFVINVQEISQAILLKSFPNMYIKSAKFHAANPRTNLPHSLSLISPFGLLLSNLQVTSENMDLDYSPSAATALLLANLTILASLGVPNSTSTPNSEHPRHLEVLRSLPSANYSVGQPASMSSSSSSSSASPTSTIPAGADYSNILKGVLNDLARHATPTSPTVGFSSSYCSHYKSAASSSAF